MVTAPVTDNASQAALSGITPKRDTVKAPVVRLKIRVRLSGGSRPFVDPVLSANGKLKPLYAVVHGKPEHRPEGSYFLRYATPDGKRVWKSVGKDAQLALAQQVKQEKSLAARAVGLQLVEDVPAPKRTLLSEAVTEYLAEVKESKAPKTFLAYSLTMKLFVAVVQTQSLEEIDRKDVLAFIRAMRDDGQSPRTIANRISYLKTFFRRFEVESPLLKSDEVKFTEKAVSAYSGEELRILFAAADPEEYDLFQFFLCTGARDGEVQHATWPDLSFPRKTYTVKERLDLGFRPKDKEEGSIPLPDDFVELMRARQHRSTARLIFPGPRGAKNVHFLRILKRLAHRAGLNCGQCYDSKGRCCRNRPICAQFGLHRFRKTFATFHHEAGVSRSDHSALAPAQRGLVNSTFAGSGVTKQPASDVQLLTLHCGERVAAGGVPQGCAVQEC
jgi:integrase